MVVLFLDFLFVKLGCYILNVQGSSQFIDILAYGGYKFVGYVIPRYCPCSFLDFYSVVTTIIASMLHIKGAFWSIIFLYVFLANAFFLVGLLLIPMVLLISYTCSFVHYALSSSRMHQAHLLHRPRPPLLPQRVGDGSRSFSWKR